MITGSGQTFCAGGDIGMLESWAVDPDKDPASIAEWYRSNIHRVPLLLQAIDKPVLAAINGAAVGAGFDVALMADIRIASEDARFGAVFCKLGIAPGDGGCYFLTRLVGLEKACELIFTGDIIDAGEAYRIGLVSRVVAPADLLIETYTLARRIASGAVLALRYSKQAIYRSVQESLDQNLDFIARAQGRLHCTEDHMEGIRAFREKRAPRFTGR